jgi:plasmid replication initiation protein
LPYLKQVTKKFVLYNLKEVANFGSLYSTRLYELIQEFKDKGWLLKSVAQLREVFAVGKKFADYYDFKRFTFAHAVDEINAQYPTMKLRFEELKEGRKVVAIDFRFTPSTTSEQYNPVTKQIVSVTSKPKQVHPKRAKKDDDNTPPPVHPDQQELPHLEPEEQPKTTMQKVARKVVESKYAEKNFAPSLKKLTKKFSEDTVTKNDLEEYKKERVSEIKNDIKKTAEEVKRIITALMEEDDLTETEATIKAIKYKLI